jgi:phytoene synthase
MDGSAVPVGRAMTYILGSREPHSIEEALPGADSLSIAMQLSNFWRDIGEDYRRIDRVYIPQEDMDYFGVSEDDLAAGQITHRMIELLEFEIERTERYYDHARTSVAMLGSGQWGVMSGLEIYRGILTSIRRNGYDIFAQRARANTIRKLGLAARAWWAVQVSG